MSILGVASIAYSGNAHLGVTAPVPMDDEHCLISSVINVDHHFLNENPCKPLLRAYIGARRIPYHWALPHDNRSGSVFGEPQPTHPLPPSESVSTVAAIWPLS